LVTTKVDELTGSVGRVSENLHPVRHVSVGELNADIDEELAPTIEVIWRLGLRTWTSWR
jgi:hypothetical protein